MNKQNKPLMVSDNLVIVMKYNLNVNGELYDSSEEHGGAISFLQGHHNIISGLEKELYGMKIGDTKKISVSPEDGYGKPDPEAMVEIPKNEIPKEIPLEIGVELELKDEEGDLLGAEIKEIKEETVILDFNHPLAGQILDFEVTILEIREASQEELSHGHSHHH